MLYLIIDDLGVVLFTKLPKCIELHFILKQLCMVLRNSCEQLNHWHSGGNINSADFQYFLMVNKLLVRDKHAILKLCNCDLPAALASFESVIEI